MFVFSLVHVPYPSSSLPGTRRWPKGHDGSLAGACRRQPGQTWRSYSAQIAPSVHHLKASEDQRIHADPKMQLGTSSDNAVTQSSGLGKCRAQRRPWLGYSLTGDTLATYTELAILWRIPGKGHVERPSWHGRWRPGDLGFSRWSW
jgi:hypothetical protein